MPACSAAQWEGGTVPSVQEGPEFLALSLSPVHQNYIELVMKNEKQIKWQHTLVVLHWFSVHISRILYDSITIQLM